MIDAGPRGAIVMKFGGTSLADADAIARALAIVRGARDEAPGPIVVVASAMAGVTDRLLDLASAAERGDEAAVAAGAEEIWLRHLEAVHRLVPRRMPALVPELERQIDELRTVLRAMTILRDASPRSLDGVASAGELLSSRVVAAAMQEAGTPAAWVDARRALVTDGAHGGAAPLMEETRAALGREVAPHLDAGRVVVVGGYVGATPQGVTTTLGRGGSDYSAAIVGAALDAAEIRIWTDVDGMLTADPRVIAAPRLVPRLSFAEASELAYFGAKVLHPSTILPAIAKDIPVRILNSRRPSGPGTLISGTGPIDERPLAAIACKRGVTVVDITSTRMLMAHGFLRRLFEVFERHRTAVDVVTTSEVSVSVTVDDDRHVEAIARDLGEIADVRVERSMAILCAVGDRLCADARLAGRVIGALEGFPLRMVSQAASRRNLTVVLAESHLPAATARLHDEFFALTAV
jgi:aspartate kinase